MVGWHHRVNGHEFEQTAGDGRGQRSLTCHSPWGHKEQNTAEQLNNSICFLTAFPLFLHSLTSLLSNCLNLLFGTQRRPKRLNPFARIKNRGVHRGFYILGELCRVLLCFNPSSLILLNSENRGKDKKENNQKLGKDNLVLGGLDFNLNQQFWSIVGLPRWLRWLKKKKKIHLQCGKPGFNPWVRKVPWRRKWQPTPVFLPGEFHEQRSLAVYSSWDYKESDMTE